MTKPLNKIQEVNGKPIEEGWQEIKECLTQVSEETLGPLPRKCNPDWFNENEAVIISALEEKKRCHSIALNKLSYKKAIKNYRIAKSKVQRLTKQLKNKWHLEKAAEIQKLADMHNSGAFYKTVNIAYGPPHNTICPIKDEQGVIL